MPIHIQGQFPEREMENDMAGLPTSLSNSGLPRERLNEHGISVLTDAELLALIIGTGTRTDSSRKGPVRLGKEFLATYGSLREMASRDERDYQGVDGIGPAKGARLAAAFELGRRLARHPRAATPAFRCPQDVFLEYGPFLSDLKREIFKVVLLNTAHCRISDFTASEGGLSSSIVEPRLIFRRAILDHAAAVICIHNHPSGNPEPSREDVAMTKQLSEAGKTLGIPIRDHIIIAGDTFTSLAERGLVHAL